MPGPFAASSSSSSMPLLLLLLPLLVSFHPSSCARLAPPVGRAPHTTTLQPCTSGTKEFNKDVVALGESLQGCPVQNCSLAPTTDRKCQCIHITVNTSHVPACHCLNSRSLTQGCAFLSYFTVGLKALSSWDVVKDLATDLISRLEDIPPSCYEEIPCPVTEEGLISPLDFQKKLKHLVELYSAVSN